MADLPQLWNQKMKEYLGCEPESDARGVLQVRGGACPVPWAYLHCRPLLHCRHTLLPAARHMRPAGRALERRPVWLFPNLLPGCHVRHPDLQGKPRLLLAELQTGCVCQPTRSCDCCAARCTALVHVWLAHLQQVWLANLSSLLPLVFGCRLRRRSCRVLRTTLQPASLSGSRAGSMRRSTRRVGPWNYHLVAHAAHDAWAAASAA